MIRFDWVSLFRRPLSSTRARKALGRLPFRLQCEKLEDRWLPSTLSFEGSLGTAQYFSNGGNATTTSLVLTTTGDGVHAGHSIIVEFALDPQGDTSGVSATDSAGNIYTIDANVIGDANGRLKPVRTIVLSSHGVMPLPAGGTITLTFPPNLAQSVTAQEFCGISAVDPVDQVSTDKDDSSVAKSSGFTAAISQPDELLIGALGVEGNIDLADPFLMNGFTPGSGYTYLPGTGTPSGNNGNKNNSIHAEYQIVSPVTPTAYQADGILNTNANGKWAMAIVTYEADAARSFKIDAPAAVSGEMPFTVTVSARDGFDGTGSVVPGYTGTVHFTVSDLVTGEVLPIDYTFTVADAGTHTFTNGFTLIGGGLRTITAEAECGGVTGSTTVNVLAPHLAFGVQPTNTVAGAVISPPVTVRIENADGSLRTTATDTITLTIASGPGTFTGGSTLVVSAVGGIATYSNLSLTTAGTYTIRATDTDMLGTNFGSVISTPFVVTAAATTTTLVSSSNPSVYGDSVTFTATVTSASSGVLGTPTGSVTFREGAVILASSVPLNGSGAASFSTSSLSAGTHAIVAEYSGSASYAVSSDTENQLVNPKALTITASSTSKTYGQTVTFAGTEFTASGLINGNTVTSVTLTSAGAAATAAVSGSPYAIVPSAAVGTGLSNYTITYVNGALTVNARALTVTANSTSKTYGQTVTFAGTEFTSSGLVNSDTVTSVTLTSAGAAATATVAGSPYAIVPSAAVGSGLGNYTITYVNGALTVNAKALTVTASSTSKTYGQTVTFAGTEFTASGLINGNTVTSVTLTSAGAAATATVAGSPYAIVPSAAIGTGLGNYSISYVNGSLTVNQAALTITAANKTKTYGQTVTFDTTTPSSDFSVAGLLNSDTLTSVTLASSGAAATATVAGSPHTITVSAAVGTGLGNYSISYVNGSLTVNQAALTVTAANKVKTFGDTVVFDETSPSSDFSVVGLVNSDSVASVTLTSAGAPASATVGSYPIVPSSATGTGLGNYTISYVNGSLTVSQAALTVTAANKTKTYGQTVTFDTTTPSSDFTVTGLQGSDTVTGVTLTSAGAAATATVSGSPYTITVSAAVGTGLGNYSISYVNGSLTVNQAALTITAANKTKTYGQTVTFDTTTPSSDFSVAGLLNSDTLTSVTLASAGAAATATVAGSPYAIVPSAAVGSGLGNYSISYVNGSLTVNQAALTITAANKTKTYGQTVTFDTTTPSPDFSVAGLLNSDAVNSVTLTSAGAPTGAAVSGSPYAIVVSNAVGTGLGNYSISYVNGTLTVNKADTTTTVVAAPAPATAGKPVTFTATVSPVAPGFGSPAGTVQFQVNGGNVGAPVTVSGGQASLLTSISPQGTYTITAVYTNSDGNFNGSSGSTSLLVKAAALSFTPVDGVDSNHRGVRCNPITFELIGPEEPPGVGPYTYQIDWDGNGTIDETLLSQPREITIAHTYELTGTYTPKAIVTDQANGTIYHYSNHPDLIVNPPITIFAAALIDGNVVVGGTGAADNIYVNTTNPSNVVVQLNGATLLNPAGGPWVVNPATGHVIIHGCAGGDVIQVAGGVSAEVHGDEGNDVITGGLGHDVLWGDAGADFIQGGAGADVLIGGTGEDRLSGDAGHDVVIGGQVAPSYTYAQLRAVASAWALPGGTINAALVAAITDVEKDRLTGGSDRDWFVGNFNGLTSDDILTDFLTGTDQKTTV